MPQLDDFRVAVIATDGFEESELTEPVKALKAEGAKVDVIAPKTGKIQGFRHHDKGLPIRIDKTLDEIVPDKYDAVMLPGGALNSDALRVHPRVREILTTFQQAGKPIAAICHAPWVLISAGLVRGRKLTSYHSIQDDIRNAGGDWVDAEVIVDGNLVTSRQPDDLPAFNREMIRLFAESRVGTR